MSSGNGASEPDEPDRPEEPGEAEDIGEETPADEHAAAEWLPPGMARARFAWPRSRRALDDILVLLAGGYAGPLEDLLRLC